MVKRIIEARGGESGGEAEGLGRGSTFCFVLGRGGRGPEQLEADAEEPAPSRYQAT